MRSRKRTSPKPQTYKRARNADRFAGALRTKFPDRHFTVVLTPEFRYAVSMLAADRVVLVSKLDRFHPQACH